MIKFILVYYVRSRYLGMKKQHIEIFNTMEDLLEFRREHKIKVYEMYRQIV